MRLAVLLFGLLYVLTGLGWADGIKHVEFRSDPPAFEAYVIIGNMKSRLVRDDNGLFQLDTNHLQIQSLHNVVVLLVAPEHQAEVEVPVATLLASDTPHFPDPSQPPIHLEPTTASAQVADFFTPQHIETIVVVVLVVVIVGGVVPATISARNKKAAKQTQAARTASENMAGTEFENRVIGGYKVLRKLGRGGLGAVYEAVADGKGKNEGHVAIKIILNSEDNESIQRAQRGLQAMASLAHPNILKLYSEGTANKYFYLVMELAPGGTLQDKIKPGGVPFAEARDCIQPVGKAIAFAHAKGFVHRNLTPENVLYSEKGQAKVAGFGLTKKTSSSSQITKRPTILGTPTYMAPEQVRAEELTGAADQYSLGVVLYELLAGEPPFGGGTMDVMMAHQQTPAPSIRTARPDLPDKVDAIIARMLAKSPAERYASIDAALADLDSIGSSAC